MRRVVVACAAIAVIIPASAEAASPVTPAGWRVAPAGDEIPISHAEVGFQGPQGGRAVA